MYANLSAGFRVPTPQIFCQIRANLANMICDKGCRCRNALDLPERVELHRTDKIQYNLTNLIGYGLRKQAEYQNRNYLNPNEHGIPTQKP